MYNLFGSTLGILHVCNCKRGVLGRDHGGGGGGSAVKSKVTKCFISIKQKRVEKRLWTWNLKGKELEVCQGNQARWWCHTRPVAW